MPFLFNHFRPLLFGMSACLLCNSTRVCRIWGVGLGRLSPTPICVLRGCANIIQIGSYNARDVTDINGMSLIMQTGSYNARDVTYIMGYHS